MKSCSPFEMHFMLPPSAIVIFYSSSFVINTHRHPLDIIYRWKLHFFFAEKSLSISYWCAKSFTAADLKFNLIYTLPVRSNISMILWHEFLPCEASIVSKVKFSNFISWLHIKCKINLATNPQKLFNCILSRHVMSLSYVKLLLTTVR